MESSIKKIDEFTVEITVELGAQELRAYVKQTEDAFLKDADVQGFRKGKAPADVVRKKIGEDAIREEALKAAVQDTMGKAALENNLEIIEQKNFEVKENNKEKLTYALTATIIPAVQLGKYKGIKVKRRPVRVTEKEQESVINDLLKSRAKIASVDRPCKKGDRIEMDYTLKHNSEIVKDGVNTGHAVILGEVKLMPGFEENILGMKAGEVRHFEIDVPKDYYNKEIAGKKLDVEIKMSIVQKVETPELDDDFAKSVGKFRSAQELKRSVKNGLEREKQEKEKSRIRVELLSKIVKESKPKAPPLLIERQLDAMIRDFGAELQSRGMELPLYLAHIKKTQDELRNEWRERAEQQVKMQLVSRAIAKRENIEVKEEEVEGEFQKMLQMYHIESNPDILKGIDIDALKARIRSTLLSEKVFELLEKSAVSGD